MGPFRIGGALRCCSSAGRASSRAKSTRSRWRGHQGDRQRVRRRVRLQGVVRQGQPHVDSLVPGPRARRGAAHARPDQGRARRADPDRHPRTARRPGRRPKSPTSCRFPRSCRARPTCSSPRPRTGRVVNIKKGQFLAPLDIRHAIGKVRESGNDRVLVTERGFTFGYNNLVVDMRAFPTDPEPRRAGRLRRHAQPAAARAPATA